MKILRFRKTARRGQAGLIGMLVCIAIILVLAAMYVPQIAGDHAQPGDAPTPKERAYNVACSEYESQMNQAAFMYKNDHDDRAPRSLEQLKQYGINDEMIHAEGCYFQIDPTGHVSDLGHGQYVPVNPPASAIYAGRATGFHPDAPNAAPANDAAPGSANDAPQASGWRHGGGRRRHGFSQPGPSDTDSGYAQPSPSDSYGNTQPAPDNPDSGYTQPAPPAGPDGTIGPGGIRIPNTSTADPSADTDVDP